MKTKEIVLTSIFSAILCLMSIISLSIGTVPISLSTLAVFVLSALSKKKCAIAATLIYIIIGISGVPVFSGMQSGMSALFGNTGGYIMAYPVMAAIISYISAKNKKHRRAMLFLSLTVATLVCYIFGAGWFLIITGLPISTVISTCVLPFIPFDIIKIILSVFIIIEVEKAGIVRAIKN